MSIGLRLRELRKEKRMTLKEVGAQVGLTATAIGCYENETRKPSHDIIQKLADLYGTTTDHIIGVHNEYSNMKKILLNNRLHWDGTILREDDLNFIKHFLELRVKDQKEIERRKEDRCI